MEKKSICCTLKIWDGSRGDTLKTGYNFVSFDSHFALLRLRGLLGVGRIRT